MPPKDGNPSLSDDDLTAIVACIISLKKPLQKISSQQHGEAHRLPAGLRRAHSRTSSSGTRAARRNVAAGREAPVSSAIVRVSNLAT